MDRNALWQLYNNYQKRFEGVDKPQFYNSWQPGADPAMEFVPNSSHPAFGDRMIFTPDGQPPNSPPPPAGDGYENPVQVSHLMRLMGVG